MKTGWHVFFPDHTDLSLADTIEQAALDYAPRDRRKILAIISEAAAHSATPIESDIAFVAVKTRAWKRPERQGKQKGPGGR